MKGTNDSGHLRYAVGIHSANKACRNINIYETYQIFHSLHYDIIVTMQSEPNALTRDGNTLRKQTTLVRVPMTAYILFSLFVHSYCSFILIVRPRILIVVYVYLLLSMYS